MGLARLLLLDRHGVVPDPLAAAIAAAGCAVRPVSDVDEALALLESEPWDVVLGDRRLAAPLLARATALGSPPAVILFDPFGSATQAVEDIRRGAFDCLALPATTDQVLLAVDRALQARRLARENRDLREDLEQRFQLENLTSRDARMQRIFEVVRSVADSGASILIEGESGTGKTMLARAIHNHSGRREQPFVHVNCGALPASLLESELFGHVKGAFTGAVRDRVGKFEAAGDGTLFLDEITTASPELQVKLLRVLENGRFERVGDGRTLESRARLITATNLALADEVAAGRFREDLRWRIDVVRIEVPPLRERPADVPHLAEGFVERLCREHGRALEGIAPDAMALLVAHPWPGNVRQLQHALERAVLLARGPRLEIGDLGSELLEGLGGAPRAALPTDADPLDALPLGPLKTALEIPERRIILRALEHTGGSRKSAAALLGINRTTLFNKMKKYKLLDFPRESPHESPGEAEAA